MSPTWPSTWTAVRPNDGQMDGRPCGRPSEEAPLLAALVRDLQQQNLELAGLVGSLQQRLMFAEDRIHAPRGTA